MVLDINDNSPTFAQPLYKVEIHENTLTGTDITQVFAADADEGTNGQVRYGIIDGNTHQEFRIDSVTGTITVARPLDREKTPTYVLIVQATDRGSTPRTDTSNVNIALLDINDFVPIFELSPYSVNVPENLGTLPRTILQVSIFKYNKHYIHCQTADLNALSSSMFMSPHPFFTLIHKC
jgi:protocadherin Fat 4